ncbi:MAG: ribonuclease III [Deltaproteobacteria bacterium]|nr:ribonuclease III [Deltaproteobacteria bacterium]
MNENRIQELLVLERAIDYRFSNPRLLDTALTHRSYVNENQDCAVDDNERLEFLGDAVLQLCISDLLIRKFPNSPEGQLSKIRSSLVNEKPLAETAKRLSIGALLLLGRGEELSGGRRKPSVLADAFEAVIAAIYTDGGYETTRAIIERLFLSLVEDENSHLMDKDPKTLLQEYTMLAFRIMPRYDPLGDSGPDHDKIFRVRVSVGTTAAAVGQGKSKKEAEQEAAREALRVLGQGKDQ